MHNLFQKAEPIESEMFSFGPKMRCNNKKADRGIPDRLNVARMLRYQPPQEISKHYPP